MTTKQLWACVLVAVSIGVGSWWVSQRGTEPVPTPVLNSLLVRSTPTPTPVPTPTFQTVKILFGGDLMFDRTIRQRMAQRGLEFPLAPLQSLFRQYDVVVANLEGPITPWESKSVGSIPGEPANFLFTFQPEIVPMLLASNLKIVNLGNNHITNFGRAGVATSKEYLQAGGVQFFGNTGTETSSEERTLVTEFGGRQIAWVNLNQFTPDGFESSLADVQAATTAADIVIVIPHWGEEYQPRPNQVIRSQAIKLLEAGADLIVGAHPHVVQNWEEIDGKRVYYSLGNMVFDQYFSAETRRGLLVGLEITPTGEWLFTEYPIQLEPSGQTKLFQPSPSPVITEPGL